MNPMIKQEAMQDAIYVMSSRVQPAVDDISSAIAKVTSLLDHGTWSGPAAQSWIDEWTSVYKLVISLLNEMPGAERQVIQDAPLRAGRTPGR